MQRLVCVGHCRRLLLLLTIAICMYGGTAEFLCDGDVALPSSHVDDDYCDCVDLSDEPHTAACASPYLPALTEASSSAAAVFHCVNRGFLPRNISAAFVLDSICDCCDGSDERPLLSALSLSSSSACSNRCQREAVQFGLEHHSQLAAYKQGVTARSSLLIRITPVQQGYQSEYDWLTANMPRLKQQVSDRADRWYNLTREEQQAQPELYAALQQENQQAKGWRFRHALLGGLLGLQQEERQETEEEAAERVKAELKKEKKENKLKRERGEKVYKKTAAQLAAREEASKPQQRAVQRKVTSSLLSDIWLSLHWLCADTQWEQRLYGERGVVIDQYRISVCPLHNATQVKLHRQGETGGQAESDSEGQPVVLGFWEGVVRTWDMLLLQREMEALRREQAAMQQQFHSIQGMMTPDKAELKQSLSAAFDAAQEVEKGIQRRYSELQQQAAQPRAPYSPSPLMLLSPPVYYMRYVGGEPCYGAGEREVLLRLVCGRSEGQLTDVRENGKCRYEMTLSTSAACEGRWGREATKQLETLQRQWEEEWKDEQGSAAAAQTRKDEL